MALPKQVQEQAEQIDALEKQLYGDKEPADPNKPVAELVQPEAEQPVEPAKEPEAAAPDPAPEPEPAKEKPSKQDDDDASVWKQKYKTLQGMYDAEVPRLHGQVKDLTSQISDLTAKFEASQQAAAEAATQAEQSLVTDEDRQEFGDDLLEVQRKVAREVAAPLQAELDAMKAENNKLREQLETTGQQVSTTSFEAQLTNAIPNWAAINTSPEWIAWLEETDPMLRGPRKLAAQKAYTEGDIEGVSYYVKLFLETQQKPASESKAENQPELESQIQPETAATPQATPQSQQGEYLTDADIRNMFNKIMQLNAQGRQDEARKLEAKIDSAYANRRVAV